MKLEKELENDHDYEEGHGGKQTRYNASNEREKEPVVHMPNREQPMQMVQVLSSYSRVLQAPALTHVQEDIDMDRGEKQQFLTLSKLQPPRALVVRATLTPTKASS